MKWDDHSFEEWQSTRELLKNYDDRIHDIRKYGFTFITALLATQAILLPYLPNQSNSGLPDNIKTGILAITLLLILALAFFEKSYQLYQEAAAQRSIILELRLNLNFSKSLSYQFNDRTIKLYETLVYVLFVLTTFGISLFVLDLRNYLLPIFLFIVSMGILLVISKMKHSGHPNWPNIDWSVNKLECIKGEKIEITATNLGKKPVVARAGKLVYGIKRQDKPKKEFKTTEHITLHQYESYTWFWDTYPCNEGVYQIFPLFPKSCSCNNNIFKKIVCNLISWDYDQCFSKNHVPPSTFMFKRWIHERKQKILCKVLEKDKVGKYPLSRTVTVYNRD